VASPARDTLRLDTACPKQPEDTRRSKSLARAVGPDTRRSKSLARAVGLDTRRSKSLARAVGLDRPRSEIPAQESEAGTLQRNTLARAAEENSRRASLEAQEPRNCKTRQPMARVAASVAPVRQVKETPPGLSGYFQPRRLPAALPRARQRVAWARSHLAKQQLAESVAQKKSQQAEPVQEQRGWALALMVNHSRHSKRTQGGY
jgi:hypothetical protein